jgi:uncharacterized protein
MPELINGIGWFEVATDDPATAERFYGGLFGWSVAAGAGGYRAVSTPAKDSVQGGLMATEGKMPNHAIFYVQVADVPATARAAEAAGGKVLVAAQTTPDGLVFAHLLDPAGNHFGIFRPPAG